MAKIDWNSILNRIKTIIKKVAKVFFTRDTVTFLLFLCLASAFWFMHSIGTRRALAATAHLVYVGIPADVLITNELPQEITFSIKNEGQKLMSYYLNSSPDTLIVDLTNRFKKSGQVIYDVQTLKNDIQSRLPELSQVEALNPGFITLHYVRLSSKQLPVRLQDAIPLASQYVLLDSITIKPSVVTFYAPQSALDTMSFVSVKPFSVEPLTKTSVFKKSLVTFELGHSDVTEVEITVPVELSTEKSLEIPIQSVDFPAHISLRTFPAFVRVTFSVGVSRFNFVTEKDFKAEVLYAELEKSKEHKVKVQVSTLNPDVLNMRYAPTDVEFLLEKE